MSTWRASRRVRRSLQRLGGHLSDRRLDQVKSVHSYLAIGHWLRELGARVPADVGTRFDLFDRAAQHVNGSRPLYLEFGVFRGESLRWWSERLQQPEARLVGFDSFQGLPEDWRGTSPRGYFSTEGEVPRINDDRVSFEVGWFDATLPDFKLPHHDQLVVNIDADLYSSARLVLDSLDEHLTPGTLIYFDEFNDRDHEMRAFREHLSHSGKRVMPLGTAQGGVHWLFQYR